MANPSGTATDVGLRVQAEQPNDGGPRRVPALLGAVGGGLVVVSYFLPWTIGALVVGGQGVANVVVFTGWDDITRVASGVPYFDSRTGGVLTSPGSIPYALLAAAPLLMGAIIVALGLWAFFQRPRGLRAGMYAAAGGLAVISSFAILNSGPSQGLYAYGGYGLQLPSQPLVGLGPLVLYVGLFALIAGGVAVGIRRA